MNFWYPDGDQKIYIIGKGNTPSDALANLEELTNKVGDNK